MATLPPPVAASLHVPVGQIARLVACAVCGARVGEYVMVTPQAAEYCPLDRSGAYVLGPGTQPGEWRCGQHVTTVQEVRP